MSTEGPGWTAYFDAVKQHEQLGHSNVLITFWETQCRECGFKATLTINKGNPFDFNRGHLAEWGCWINGECIV